MFQKKKSVKAPPVYFVTFCEGFCKVPLPLYNLLTFAKHVFWLFSLQFFNFSNKPAENNVTKHPIRKYLILN